MFGKSIWQWKSCRNAGKRAQPICVYETMGKLVEVVFVMVWQLKLRKCQNTIYIKSNWLYDFC